LKKDIKKRFDRELEEKQPLAEGVEPPKTLQEEEDKFVEETLAAREEPLEEDAKTEEIKKIRFRFLTELFQKDKWKTELLGFNDLKVIKHTRILQSLFYLLKYNREQICEDGTNRLFWKKAKKFFNDDILTKIAAFSPYGPKTEEYKKYQMINFIEKNLSESEIEAVEEYNPALAKLYKWLQTAIEFRKEDVKKRHHTINKLKEERTVAQNLADDRNNKRENDLNEAKNVSKLS
jgi:hypothetical protein